MSTRVFDNHEPVRMISKASSESDDTATVLDRHHRRREPPTRPSHPPRVLPPSSSVLPPSSAVLPPSYAVLPPSSTTEEPDELSPSVEPRHQTLLYPQLPSLPVEEHDSPATRLHPGGKALAEDREDFSSRDTPEVDRFTTSGLASGGQKETIDDVVEPNQIVEKGHDGDNNNDNKNNDDDNNDNENNDNKNNDDDYSDDENDWQLIEHSDDYCLESETVKEVDKTSRIARNPTDGGRPAISDDATTITMLVKTLKILEKGDHVAWRRSSGAYWHHGIVVDVDAITGRVEVINYNGDVVRYSDGEYASVRREWVTVNLRKRTLYRIEYEPGRCCYPADVVVDRAEGRMGEARYNPLTENCEHFARWCKTGEHRSVQVEVLPRRLLDAAVSTVTSLAGENVLVRARERIAKLPVDRPVKAGLVLVNRGAKAVFARVGARVADGTVGAMDRVDAATDRIFNELSKVEEIKKKLNNTMTGRTHDGHDKPPARPPPPLKTPSVDEDHERPFPSPDSERGRVVA